MYKAIVRAVSPLMNACELTHRERQPIDLPLAREQHQIYMQMLTHCGCELLEACAEPSLPDSIFVEDTAVVLPELAIITHPGAASRRAECASVAEILKPFRALYFVDQHHHLDGGDVLVIDKNIFIGLSGRTDQGAIRWMRELLTPWGYQVKAVPLTDCLHLKSAVTYVGENQVLLNPIWVDSAWFSTYHLLPVDALEPDGANALWVGGEVIYSTAYPRTADLLHRAGLTFHLVDNSEVIKAEGAITCCSIVF